MTHTLDLKSIPNRIDDAGAFRAFVVELFYGWGYNAYKTENKLRADDQLVRNEICGWLGQARAIMVQREADFRREALPTPTREKPFPDAGAVATAQAMQRSQKAVEALEVQIRNLPTPLDDRTWARHRNRDETLAVLRQVDLDLAGAVLGLVQDIAQSDRFEVLANHSGPIQAILQQRRGALSVFAQAA